MANEHCKRRGHKFRDGLFGGKVCARPGCGAKRDALEKSGEEE